MSLPVHEKTWQFDLNNSISTSGATGNRQLLVFIKDIMKGFALNPWIVISSSNSVTYGNSDLWIAYTDVVWGNSSSAARSWIVLEQSGTGIQILIDCRNATAVTTTFYCYSSDSGSFSGGTTTAAPTAFDQILISEANAWGTAASSNHVVHAMQTTDGYCTRIFSFSGGQRDKTFVFWNFERMKNTPDNILSHYLYNISNSGTNTDVTNSGTYIGYLCNNAAGRIQTTLIDPLGAYYNSNIMYTSEAAEGTMLSANVAWSGLNDISNKFQFTESNLYINTSFSRAICGKPYDFFLANSGLNLSFFSDANGSARKWVVVQNVVFPWDGSSNINTT